ncbi:MAG TPA: hypothetical protein VEQ63_07815 [Bryobacteraceae bacterium]|nr:hypothetical protein [Bryobacteraceae bacterium]
MQFKENGHCMKRRPLVSFDGVKVKVRFGDRGIRTFVAEHIIDLIDGELVLKAESRSMTRLQSMLSAAILAVQGNRTLTSGIDV